MSAAHILLWDIDGTLIWTHGAGIGAMTQAFEDLFGIARALDGLDYQGRSDAWIIAQVLARHGVAETATTVDRFVAAYAAALPASLLARQGHVLPGVRPLLDALTTRAVVQGLGTGNLRRTGMTKLAHFGLDGYFRDGGFGDDSPDRPTLLAAGLARLRPQARADATVVVIGDTVHDVTAGQAIGARVVAVATGSGARADLDAAGADAVLDDFTDLDAALAALLG